MGPARMKKDDDAKEIERRIYELSALIDQDPQSAIEGARALTFDEGPEGLKINALRAGILIDAGVVGNDVRAVDDGVAMVEHLLDCEPDRGDLKYYLANGLIAQADLVGHSGPEWYCETADLRREARRLFRVAEEGEAGSLVASQSLTNLGNALRRAYRFVEAYDCYLRALQSDPSNGVALTGAARILLWLANEGTGDRNVLLEVAARHLRTAREKPERISELAGEGAYKKLRELIETEIGGGEPPDLSSANDYQRFVAKHRLALAPTIEGLDLSMARWDSLRIESITEPIDTGHGVPPVFAMFNVLKSDYLTARLLAHLALKGELIESGKYSDTLDYANYGIRCSLLTLAQRSCMDLLDKTAVAASEYLGLSGGKQTTFLKRWLLKQKGGGALAWQSEVRDEIVLGNTALIALAEVSCDIATGGFLQAKRLMRHTSTHRFTVLHDFETSPSRECRLIDHYVVGDFEDQLVETLQLARAVLFYFVEMIKLREKRLSSDSPLKGSLVVPDHDWVRGEEDER